MIHQPPHKLCPACGQPSVLSAVSCGRCGHQFSTRFADPLNQTQAIGLPAAPVHASEPPKTRDKTEWTVAVIWGWTGIFFTTLGALLFVDRLPISHLADEDTAARLLSWAFIGLFALALAGVSYFVMRLRRLYRYERLGDANWWFPLTVVFVLLVVAYFGMGSQWRGWRLPSDAGSAQSAAPLAPSNADYARQAARPPVRPQTVRQMLAQCQPGMTPDETTQAFGVPASGLWDNAGVPTRFRFNATDGYVIVDYTDGRLSGAQGTQIAPAPPRMAPNRDLGFPRM